MTPYELEPVEFGRAAEPLDGPFCNEMLRLASAHRLWTVFTMNERGPRGDGGERPYNTAVVADSDGERRAVYRKVHLFDTDFTKESAKVAAGGELFVPLETPFCKLGLGICYDVRFPELARDAVLAGCEVLLYPAAWVHGPGKVRQWTTLLSARAIENELFVAGLSRCDRAFGAARRDYAGNSCVFDPLGVPIAEAGIDELFAELRQESAVQAAANAEADAEAAEEAAKKALTAETTLIRKSAKTLSEDLMSHIRFAGKMDLVRRFRDLYTRDKDDAFAGVEPSRSEFLDEICKNLVSELSKS